MNPSTILKFNYIKAKNSTPLYFVYLLECSDGKYYTGYSENLGRRYIQHKKDLGANFTKGKDVKLAYFESHATKEQALKREKEIKKAPKHYRDRLATDFALLMKIVKDDLSI